jgi:two-component system, NtrC family, sensor kinase
MRVARKLSLFLITGMVLVLAVNGAVRVQREAELFETDIVRDHAVLGRALAASAVTVWNSEGPLGAARHVRIAGSAEKELDTRWIWLDPPDRDAEVALSADDRTALVAGNAVHRFASIQGTPMLVSAFPVMHGKKIQAAVEVRESLISRDAYVRTSVLTTVFTTLALIAIVSVLTLWLGVSLVGRPVHELVEQARRVGRGDLSHRLTLKRRDELGELAEEVNAMCDQLSAANSRVASETAARIAALQQLRHADRLMTVGKLASGIAHELGTPLNVVSGRAKMIAKTQVTGDAALENARIIGEQAERMTGIIRQLLDFARARGPKKSAIDLSSIASQTAALLAPLASKRAIAIDLDMPEDLPRVEVDPSQIQQVMTNLVVNALQACDRPGAVRLELARSRERTPPDKGGEECDVVRITVLDQGAGIAPDVLDHVFEPFYTTKDVGEGTGLGLSVAYGIVHEHGGWIEAESKVGEGSRFSVYLPVVKS